MKLSEYYLANLRRAEERAADETLDPVTRNGQRIQAESCKEQLAKIASGEEPDLEI